MDGKQKNIIRLECGTYFEGPNGQLFQMLDLREARIDAYKGVDRSLGSEAASGLLENARNINLAEND